MRRVVFLFSGTKVSARLGWNVWLPLLALSAASLCMLLSARGQDVVSQEVIPPRNQAAEYADAVPKTILELQQFRQTTSSPIRSGAGAEGMATLINLNPTINVWYLLKVAWQDGSESSYHLENPEPRSRTLSLDSKYPAGIEILEGKARYPCNLFEGGATSTLNQAKNSQLIYAPLCDTRLFLRNPVKGHRTSLEAGAEFLRKQVWGGETIITVFHHLLEDSHRETAEMRTAEHEGSAALNREMQGDLPLPAVTDPKYVDRLLTPSDLGLALETSENGGMRPGAWYSASGNPASTSVLSSRS